LTGNPKLPTEIDNGCGRFYIEAYHIFCADANEQKVFLRGGKTKEKTVVVLSIGFGYGVHAHEYTIFLGGKTN
jgi:hypothetical protein